MPKWFEKILKYNPGEKSLKAPFAIYLDLPKKKQSYQNNNHEKSYALKTAKHEPSDWGMLTRCSFDEEENKLHYHRGKDCISELCKTLKEREMEISNYEKQK